MMGMGTEAAHVLFLLKEEAFPSVPSNGVCTHKKKTVYPLQDTSGVMEP